MARRAQLAVVAHIRHLYTDYDRLLKVKSFHEARSSVEQSTLAKLIAWRGDDENGQTVLEDVFREVIVISDDEESESEEEGRAGPADTGDQDGGILFENTRAPEIHTQPVNATELSYQDPLRESSEEPQTGFQIISRVPARKAIDRRGFSRYQAWNRALTRYRAGTQNVDLDRHDDPSAEQQRPKCTKRPPSGPKPTDPIRGEDGPPPHTEAVSGASQPLGYPHKPAQKVSATAADGLTDRNLLVAQKQHFPVEDRRSCAQLAAHKPPDVRQFDASTRSLNSGLLSSYGAQGANAPPRHFLASNDKANVPVFVRGPQDIPPRSETQVGPASRVPFPHRPRSVVTSQDYVLPSVETPWPLENRPVEGHLEHLTERMSLRSIPVRRAIQHDGGGSTSSVGDQIPKRRRLGYDAACYLDNGSMGRNVQSSSHAVGGYPFRASGVSRPNLLSAHCSDRSSFMERGPPSLLGPSSGILWETSLNDPRMVNTASSRGQLYADDFVRPVNIQASDPVHHYAQRPRPEVQHAEETSSQNLNGAAPGHMLRWVPFG